MAKQTGPIASYQVLQQAVGDLQSKLDEVTQERDAARGVISELEKDYQRKAHELEMLEMAFQALQARKK